jgi:hypothetical protein
MTAFVFGLIGLVAGSLLQTATGLFTDWRSAKREHKVWLRDKREAAFVNYMTVANEAALAAYRSVSTEEALNHFAEAVIPAQVYAPSEEALDAVKGIQGAVAAMFSQPRGKRDRTQVREQLRAYDRAMRKALMIPREGEPLEGEAPLQDWPQGP